MSISVCSTKQTRCPANRLRQRGTSCSLIPNTHGLISKFGPRSIARFGAATRASEDQDETKLGAAFDALSTLTWKQTPDGWMDGWSDAAEQR